MSKGNKNPDPTNLKYIGPSFIKGFLVGPRIWNPDTMSPTEVDEFITLVPEANEWWVKYETSESKPAKGKNESSDDSL